MMGTLLMEMDAVDYVLLKQDGVAHSLMRSQGTIQSAYLFAETVYELGLNIAMMEYSLIILDVPQLV